MPSLRTSTIRVTGEDGVPWEGTGEGLGRAVGDLVRRRAARRPGRDPLGGPAPPAVRGDPAETRWRLTAAGEAVVAALRRAAAVAEETDEHAAPAKDGGEGGP